MVNSSTGGETMETEYELYHGDCLKVMDELIKKGIKVDLTITSPPYDDLRNYDNSLEWNFEIFKNVADRLYQITENGGVVVWVVGDKTKTGSETGTSFKQALYFKEIGFNLHDTMIYAKNNPVPQVDKSRYTQSFEYMFILSKNKPKTVNRIVETTKNGGKVHKSTNGNVESSDRKKRSEITKKFKPLKNIWFYTIGTGNTSKDKIAFKHPAVFPEQLAEDHILTWSNENDVVFDCFMGSNTTGKMALLNNRRFIGIEKVKDYFELSKQRISFLDETQKH